MWQVSPVVQLVEKELSKHWERRIAPHSRTLCKGLDELRVDWLLGDIELGPRLGELSYQGAGFTTWPELGVDLAQGYLAAVAARGSA